MSTAFFALLNLAFLHYTYEAIIAPSVRMRLKHRLFALRDRVRMIQIERDSSAMQSDLAILHDGLNYYLNRLEYITPTLLVRSRRRLRTDAHMRQAIAQRTKIIADSTDPRIPAISREIDHVLSKALLANAGGWCLYILPIVMAWLTFARVKRFVAAIFMTPERSIQSMMDKGLHA